VKGGHPLRAILEEAARGRFPPPDGSVSVVPSPPGAADAVIAFTAHCIVAADVSEAEVLAHLDPSDLGAPVGPGFLSWLAHRLESSPGSLDVVLAAPGLESDTGVLREVDGATHDRIERAERYRDDVTVFAGVEGTAVLAIGSGLAGRREVSLEIEETARGRGLGRRLLLAVRGSIPPGEFVFAQVAPGNALSLRAFLAAGFAPIGAEVLFLKDGASTRPPVAG
jgi:GNAT superfamily N-acetyltransferase